MKQIKLALVLFLLSSLFGCAQTVVKPKPISKPSSLDIQLPQPLKLESISWVVITKDNYQQIINSSENKNGLVFLVALDEKGYKNISLNHTKVLRYIREQKSVIAAYRKYYDTESKK